MARKEVPNVANVKSYLTPKDRERIKDEMADIERRLKAGSELGSAGAVDYYRPPEVDIDPAELKKRHGILKNTLETESPQKLVGPKSNAALKEYNKNIEELKKYMITKKEQDMFPAGRETGPNAHTPEEFLKARDRCIELENSPRALYLQQRIKELAGQIDPDDPTLRNIERFRPRR